MLKFHIAPTLILVQAIEGLRTKHGAIEVIEDQPCGTGKIIQMNTTKFPDMKVGDTAFFHMERCRTVRLENGLMHGIIHEDHVLGWADAADAEGVAKHVGNVKLPSKIVQAHGLELN